MSIAGIQTHIIVHLSHELRSDYQELAELRRLAISVPAQLKNGSRSVSGNLFLLLPGRKILYLREPLRREEAKC